MKHEPNPYQQLVIYNFDGTINPGPGVEADPRFLGNWVEDDTSFLFFSRPAPGLVDGVMKAHPGKTLVDVYEMTCEEWHGDRIEPYTVERLRISPPWEPQPPSEDTIDIQLDPGVVFGTGRHQTTEDCLSLIHRICSREAVNTVMDIGTGTGLLALGAAALGCNRVLACDFNLLAVKTARKNIGLNRFDDRILAFQARGEDVMTIPSDLLVANIHYDVMQHLIQSPALLEKRFVILSGLLNSETTRVLDVLAEKGMAVLQRRCPDGIWNTILARPGKREENTN